MPKAQAAMEYITNYGWMILIVAVVVALMFRLGLFNATNFEARTLAGSCKVYRPNGRGTITQIALVGLCDNPLPQDTMLSKGIGDYVLLNNSNLQSSPLDITGSSITITAWVYLLGSPYHDVVDKEGQYGMKLDYNNQPHACAPSDNAGLCLEWDTVNDWNGISYPIPNGNFNKWIFVAVTMNATEKEWYANGQPIGNEVVSGGLGGLSYFDSNTVIGAISPYNTYGYGYGGAEWFDGSISNVQLYNSSLNANEIHAMYVEGLGGVPINLANLVGWWPLNGNPNDYGGNNQNGHIFNDIYSSGSWYSGYVS